MHNIDWKKEILTIPNLLSLFRLVLIPVYVTVYLNATEDWHYYLAASILAASCVTDLLDGQIARRFNMISNLGKLLDPIADKATQFALIICLSFRYSAMIFLIILFVIKEGAQFIALGLNLKKGMTDAEREETAMKYIKMVGLEKFVDAYPKELSGGMKQRVAIARAYAADPEVLLLDEPFGALDAQTRTQLQTELLKTWEEEKKTCFFITHDVEEAILLSSRVVVMSARPGRIKEVIDIDIPYPRNQETKILPRFTELKNYIWNMVYKEYLEVQK